jgi:Methylamine utilisation protein MauE
MFLPDTAEVAIGSILLLSGSAKLIDRKGFVSVVRGYEILPNYAVPTFAAALPVIEVLVAVALLSRMVVDSPLNAWAGFVAVCLFAMFGIAITVNLIRGRTEISCGCFGNTSQKLTWGLVGRSTICLAVSLITLPITQRGAVAATSLDRLSAALVGVAIVAAAWLCRFIVTRISMPLESQS